MSRFFDILTLSYNGSLLEILEHYLNQMQKKYDLHNWERLQSCKFPVSKFLQILLHDERYITRFVQLRARLYICLCTKQFLTCGLFLQKTGHKYRFYYGQSCPQERTRTFNRTCEKIVPGFKRKKIVLAL